MVLLLTSYIRSPTHHGIAATSMLHHSGYLSGNSLGLLTALIGNALHDLAGQIDIRRISLAVSRANHRRRAPRVYPGQGQRQALRWARRAQGGPGIVLDKCRGCWNPRAFDPSRVDTGYKDTMPILPV